MLCLSRYSTLRDQDSAAACAVVCLVCSVHAGWSQALQCLLKVCWCKVFLLVKFSAASPLYSNSVDYIYFSISIEYV